MAGRKENLVERQKADSIEGLLEHCGEMAGRKENLVERGRMSMKMQSRCQ
jgi:hypothetical protein